MTGEKDPRDVMQAEHDARLSKHPAFQAPAEMPGVEEIARAMCKAQHYDPDFDYDPNGISDLPGTNVRWKLYVGQARAILALFAPVLAEKERLASYWLYQHDQGQEEIRQLSDNLAFAEYETKALEARALAAEAALTGERERADMAVRQMIKQNDRLAALAQIAAPGAAMEE